MRVKDLFTPLAYVARALLLVALVSFVIGQRVGQRVERVQQR